MDADLAAEAAELVRQDVADDVVVEARGGLGVDLDQLPEELDHVVPVLLDVGEDPLLLLVHFHFDPDCLDM